MSAVPNTFNLNARSSGDNSAVVPPVPIPNTEVKRCSPDDSASIGCAKVGRRQFPRLALAKIKAGRPFFVAGLYWRDGC